MTRIPDWINRAADEIGPINKDAKVNFSDETHSKLLKLHQEGKLDPWAKEALEEIETLRGVMNEAVLQVDKKLAQPMTKEAKVPPAPPKKAEVEAPLDFGDERLKEEMTPALDEKGKEVERLPATKVKQPETTKWKEIRFNKRTGTWQTTVTIRHTRNFMSENEAVEFAKKANLTEKTK